MERIYRTDNFFDSSYLNVVNNGTFYFPAWKHYGRSAIVVCDRCKKNDIRACIGYVDRDLCLECVDTLTCSNKITQIRPIFPLPPGPIIIHEKDKCLEDLCDEVRIIRKNNLN